MDVAIAVLYCKSGRSDQFEVLLEDSRFAIAGSSSSSSKDGMLRSPALNVRRRSPLMSSENRPKRQSSLGNGGGCQQQRSPLRKRSPTSDRSDSRSEVKCPSGAVLIGTVGQQQQQQQQSLRLCQGDRSQQQQQQQQLPRQMISFDQEPSEVASMMAGSLFRTLAGGDGQQKHQSSPVFKRAVPVVVWHSEPSSPCQNIPIANCCDSPGCSHLSLGAALFCVPVSEKGTTDCKCSVENDNNNNVLQILDAKSNNQCNCRYRFYALDQIVNLCRNASSLVDTETRHLLLRLDEWLKERTKQSQFLANLYGRPAASSRLRVCVHNPAHVDESRSCDRTLRPGAPAPVPSRACRANRTDLPDEVRTANTVLAWMMAAEKCDRFVINPLFGSGMPYKVNQHHQLSPSQYQYVAKGRPEPRVLRNDYQTWAHQNPDGSDAGSIFDDYPLHRAAQLGQLPVLKQLLAQNYDANQLDRDHWAPIHYAAWYGQLGCLQVLLNHGQNCLVNIRNKNGSTPLHFAAWCGHQYVVELLLTHPDIDPEARDKDGKSALNLCECVPKPEWQAVAELLRARLTQICHTPKIQVDLMDGSNVMLSLSNGADTTADELHEQMLRELGLNEECGKLFALWICSESLQLQLKGEHKPVQHLQKWQSKLAQWSDVADTADYNEKALLVFRRDARVRLMDEKKVMLNHTTLALLYHEAHQNYLRGLYPCVDHDVIMLAATVLQIINGDYASKKDKPFLSSEKSLGKILPTHKLKDKHHDWLQQIMKEHKHVTARGQNSLPNLQHRHLTFCQTLRLYGSAFFTAVMFVEKPVKGALYVHAGINDAGLHLINCETKALYGSFEYANLFFSFKPERPFISLRGKDGGVVHEFTLKTKQANMINTLMRRFVEMSSAQ